MKRVALILALVASPVVAKPVYLQCSIYKVTLDEDGQTLTFQMDDKEPTVLRAQFTPDTVTASNPAYGAAASVVEWHIDRNTGVFGGEFAHGKCEVIDVSKRAF